MTIDPDNPVVKLCADGMRAEAEEPAGAAKALYEQAWEGPAAAGVRGRGTHRAPPQLPRQRYVHRGLLPAPQKASATRGIYSDEHVELLAAIEALKLTGVSRAVVYLQ